MSISQELKNKIKASMEEYLKSKGWPDKLSLDKVIQIHLPHLWKKLENEGLTKDVVSNGFGYKQFVDSAINAKKHEDMRKMFEDKMKDWGFW